MKSKRLNAFAVLALLGATLVTSTAVSRAQSDTIPMWTYTTTSSRDGQTYEGTMVGLSPFSSPDSTTSIPTQIVPLIVRMPDGGVFDPTAADPCAGGIADVTLVEQSPIFQNSDYTVNGATVGQTQYLDAFQRANFWKLVNGHPYHTLLSVTTLPAITVNVPAGMGSSGTVVITGGCIGGVFGFLAGRTWLDQLITGTLLPQLAAQGVNPTTFPIFLLSNVTIDDPTYGADDYHAVTGSPAQTYAVVHFNSVLGTLFCPPGVADQHCVSESNLRTDVRSVAPVLADWLTDPLGTNATPSWGARGATCQTTLHVAVPLDYDHDIFITMPNGRRYHLPELAFFSWFLGGPSLGAGDLFSNNRSFRGYARPCPIGGSYPTVPGDIDGDGHADLVTRDVSTGTVRLATGSTEVIFWPSSAFNNVPLGWQIVGINDVDGDGLSDLVWRHMETGDVAVWFMNGATLSPSVREARVVSTGVPLAWHIAGVGDLDGDGNADLVWRHMQTGEVAVWLMDGGRVKETHVVATVPLEWQIAGLGHVDGDVNIDIVWRDSRTGDVAVWLMDGAAPKQTPVVATGVPLSWQIAGIGDMNGDGKSDLVWRQTQTGDVAVWLMDGTSVMQTPVISVGVPLVWQIAKVQDMDGDGRADLIWHDTQTGVVAVWLMAGATVELSVSGVSFLLLGPATTLVIQ
jgi:hypothetical protein